MAAVNGCRVLRRGPERGAGPVRKAGIFNTDQGTQLISFDFTGVLKDAGFRIFMDDRGRFMENICVERLWRSPEYVDVFLHESTDGFKAERVIAERIGIYNAARPHSALADQTTVKAYYAVQSI